MLSVWVESENPAATFWDQTPRTFAAIMRGCARRERRRHDLALAAGWHAENFSRAGKSLKDLGSYLRQSQAPAGQTADEAAAIWQGFAERGLVTIREVRRD